MLVFAIIIYLPPKEKRVSFYSRYVYTNNKTNLNKGKEEMTYAIIFLFTSNNLWLECFFSFQGENIVLNDFGLKSALYCTNTWISKRKYILLYQKCNILHHEVRRFDKREKNCIGIDPTGLGGLYGA